jgi:hypothetical protein
MTMLHSSSFSDFDPHLSPIDFTPDTQTAFLRLISRGETHSIDRFVQLYGAALLSKPARWYGRKKNVGSKWRMRTPLMIAALFGHFELAISLIGCGCCRSVSEAAVDDGSTALHLAIVGLFNGTSANAAQTVITLRSFGASVSAADAEGHTPLQVLLQKVASDTSLFTNEASAILRLLSTGGSTALPPPAVPAPTRVRASFDAPVRMSDWTAASVDDWLFVFKVQQCRELVPHDWSQCFYAHPGEKGARRDPRIFIYRPEECAQFKDGGRCRNGDGCKLSHGVWEMGFHPLNFRRSLCRDGANCTRRTCFFAHSDEQIRFMAPQRIAPQPVGGERAARKAGCVEAPSCLTRMDDFDDLPPLRGSSTRPLRSAGLDWLDSLAFDDDELEVVYNPTREAGFSLWNSPFQLLTPPLLL